MLWKPHDRQFLPLQCKEQHLKHKVRIYTAVYENQPIGYYYSVAKSAAPEKVSQEALKKSGRVKSTQCVYLGMLGVCMQHKGYGLGRLLMLDAMKQTLKRDRFKWDHPKRESRDKTKS